MKYLLPIVLISIPSILAIYSLYRLKKLKKKSWNVSDRLWNPTEKDKNTTLLDDFNK